MESNANKYLEEVKKVILDYFSGYNVKVYLIGSYAQGTSQTSAIEIALLPLEPLEVGVVSDLREIFEESTITHKVDVIDLSEADYEFRDRVLAGAQLWKG